MKIALVVRNYHKSGGKSRYIAELAAYLAGNNEVHVFTASWKDVDDPRISFHRIPMLSFNFLKERNKIAWNNIFEILSFAVMSKFIVRESDFDIVHSQGCYLGGDVFTAHSCHAESLVVLRRERAGFWGKLKKSILNPLHALLLLIERYSIYKAKKVIAVSNLVKREIVAHYGVAESKVLVIHNGVNPDEFNPKNPRLNGARIRALYGLAAGDKVIIFPAHEFERKGLRTLIEALRVIGDKKLRVLVAGEGDPGLFTGLIKKYGLADNFIFTGKVSDIENYYLASDMLVFPTSYEPFGLVVTEAMAVGLPAIVSTEAGASELIIDRINGILLRDRKDALETAAAILWLINDPGKMINMGINARKTAERYSWSGVSEETSRAYREALELKAEKAGAANGLKLRSFARFYTRVSGK